MTADLAIRALEAAVGPLTGMPTLLASGQSSVAWVATVDDRAWVARIPVPGSGRRLSFRSEERIGRLLGTAGQPVAAWRTVECSGVPVSVAALIAGRPCRHEDTWTDAFCVGLAAVLHELHTLPSVGYGPLVDDDRELRGVSQNPTAGIVARWLHARIWPFDRIGLEDHPVQTAMPDVVASVVEQREAIVAAATGPAGVVHSDLHREHLLVAEDGALAGLLDFGDAFVGAVAWDFALLHWYHGRSAAERVAGSYPEGQALAADGRTLAIAVGLYKLAKKPGDPDVPARLAEVLSA